MPWEHLPERPSIELTVEQIEKAEEAKKGINPIGVCGLYCPCCSINVMCGGCRSDYNSCSLAGLKEHNGICPNVKCAKEKDLPCCWECTEIFVCKKGFYARKRVSFAKASALFIKKYGEKSFIKTIESIFSIDEQTGHCFFSAQIGNINNKLELLEKYLVKYDEGDLFED